MKNPPAEAGGIRDMGLIPGWRRSPEGGDGNPLTQEPPAPQHSQGGPSVCLQSPLKTGQRGGPGCLIGCGGRQAHPQSVPAVQAAGTKMTNGTFPLRSWESST